MDAFSLFDLEKIVAERASSGAADSWTAKLVAGGQQRAAKKLGEEAVETAVAAVSGTRQDVIAESSDLLFRLLVLWAKVGVDPDKVMTDLAQRHGPKARPSEPKDAKDTKDAKTPPAGEGRS